MPKAQAVSEESPAATLDVHKVDKELKDNIETKPEAAADVPTTNGASDAATEAKGATAATAKVEDALSTPDMAEKAVPEEKEVEIPAEPTPTPSAARPLSDAKPVAAQPAAPAKPLTWASRAAAAAGPPKPAVPAVAPKTSTPPAQTRAPPATQPTKPAQPTPAPSATEKDKENSNPSGEWQNVSSDHAKRQNRPQSISAPPEKEGTMGYVRNVTEKVPTEELRAALGSFGKLIYFDINRLKVGAHRFYSFT